MDPSGMSQFSPEVVTPSPSQVQVIPYGVEIPNRVFVGGCPYSMSDMELAEFFSQFGQIRDSKIITDRDTGKSKGYGFVTFMTEEEASNVYTRGSIYYKEKKLNVSKAIRKHGGQYQKANTEYVNGQRSVWLHPNGYLVSQYDGSWHYELTHPHSQPSKPCYTVYPQTGIYLGQPSPVTATPQTPGYYQNPMLGAPPLTNGYNSTAAGGGYYSPTYAYVTEPLPSAPPSHPHTFTPSSTTTATPNDPRTSLEDSGSHSDVTTPEETTDNPETKSDEEGKKQATELELIDQVKQLSLDSAYTSEADITEHSLTSSTKPVLSSGDEGGRIGSSSSDSEGSSSAPLNQELLQSIFSRRAVSAPNSPHQQKRSPRFQQRRPPTYHCTPPRTPQLSGGHPSPRFYQQQQQQTPIQFL